MNDMKIKNLDRNEPERNKAQTKETFKSLIIEKNEKVDIDYR